MAVASWSRILFNVLTTDLQSDLIHVWRQDVCKTCTTARSSALYVLWAGPCNIEL